VNQVDVAIVGAGPSGAWAALVLARRGARVLLLDPSHPREKPCGGGVTGRALSIVASEVDVERMPAVEIERATFRDGAGRTVDVPLQTSSEEPPLIVASRKSFDALLVDRACQSGAAHIGARVSGVARENGHFRVETTAGTYRAGWVVGADGANSFLRGRLARRFSRSQLSIATGFFVEGATSRAIVLEITTDPPGYIWSFPRPDHIAIGICAQADAGSTVRSLRERTARWMRDTGAARDARLTPYSWPIPSLSARDLETLPVGGPGWLLVGDAAGLVDPINREGIFFALESARLAAEAILSGRRADSDYEARLRADILPELACAARLKEGFFRPRFTRLLLDALQESARVRRVMADLVAGAQSYRGLKWRLAGTLNWRLAWRALAFR